MAPPAAFRLPVLLLLASLVLTHCLTVSAGVENLHAKSQIKVSDDDDLEAPTPAGGPSVAPTLSIDCGHECGRRCSEASRQDRCLKYCNICCSKCQCVPPGTYGNKEVCPCYANLKNSKGTSKCP